MQEVNKYLKYNMYFINSVDAKNYQSKGRIESCTLRMLSGGRENTFLWSSDAIDECKGRIHSADGPRKR